MTMRRVAPILLLSLVLAGCGFFLPERPPQSYVGNWMSTDGKSFMRLSDDGTGSFTLCEPDEEDGGLRYNFVSDSWPATVAVDWAEASPNDAERVYL